MALKWKNLGVAVQGIGHERAGLPGEDKVHYREADGVYAMALCDGVGSAISSAAGADLFSEHFCHLMVNHFDKLSQYDDAHLGEIILQYLHKRLEERFEGQVMSDFAATLLGVAVKDDQYIAIHLGDGLIGYLANQELGLLSGATNFDYANVTVAVTSPQAGQYMNIIRGQITGIQSFFLMSDGSEASLYHYQQAQFSSILFDIINLIAENEAEAQEQLEELVTVRFREYTSDDCSLNFLVQSDMKPVEGGELEDFLNLSNRGQQIVLSRLDKSQKKSLSVAKLAAIMTVFHRESFVTRRTLKTLSAVRHNNSLDHAINLLMREEIIAYNPATNEYYLLRMS